MASTTSQLTLNLKLELSSEDKRYLDTLQLLKDHHHAQSRFDQCATTYCENAAAERNEIIISVPKLGSVNVFVCDICYTNYRYPPRNKGIF